MDVGATFERHHLDCIGNFLYRCKQQTRWSSGLAREPGTILATATQQSYLPGESQKFTAGLGYALSCIVVHKLQQETL